jgi:hypothetical protein
MMAGDGDPRGVVSGDPSGWEADCRKFVSMVKNEIRSNKQQMLQKVHR